MIGKLVAKNDSARDLHLNTLLAHTKYVTILEQIRRMQEDAFRAEQEYIEANNAYLNKCGGYGKNANT